MSTPEPYPYRKLNYPVNNLAQDFNATEKDQVRQNIGIPSSVNKTGKVLKVNDNTGNLSWEDESGGTGTVTDVTVNGTSVVSDGVASVTVPTNTSDLNNDSGFITASDIPPQEQADWNESNSSDPAYIKNKPTIPAAQVNSDWNASSGVAQILNKPTIPTRTSELSNDSGYIIANNVPNYQSQADWNEMDSTDPSYIQNKPTIPAAQVNSDWNASSGVAEILNKPTIPSGQDLVPSHSISDSGKVLGVNASGNTEWVTAGGGGSSDIVRLLSSNITTHQNYDDIVSAFATKEVYIKPNDVYLDYDAYFRVLKATSSIITAELPVIEDLDNGKTRYTGIIRYNITKSSGDSLTKLPTYYFTLNINLQTLGIEVYDSTKTYKQNDFVFVANPHTGSDVNSATWVYRAREDLPANVEPSMYPAAWQRLSLDDYYRHLKKISVTPDNGSIELFYTYEGKFIESTGDIQTIDSYEGIELVTIKWTVASYTTLPTVPNSWHASSSNPSNLTVGKTYQLRLVNDCYTIEEFN